MDELRLEPIGVARTAWTHPEPIPAQGSPARIEVDPRFLAALDGVESATHLHVLAWLHRADREVLRVRPRKVDPGAPERGVFAVRSPVRPNPLGLSTARLVRREGTVLHLARLDVWDGTPVLDIKPYSPGWDVVLWARHDRRTRPWELDDGALRDMLEREALDAVGPAGLDAVARAVIDRLEALVRTRRDPRDPSIAYAVPVLDRRVDLLAVMAGATFGSGRLAWDPAAAHPVQVLT